MELKVSTCCNKILYPKNWRFSNRTSLYFESYEDLRHLYNADPKLGILYHQFVGCNPLPIWYVLKLHLLQMFDMLKNKESLNQGGCKGLEMDNPVNSIFQGTITETERHIYKQEI